MCVIHFLSGISGFFLAELTHGPSQEVSSFDAHKSHLGHLLKMWIPRGTTEFGFDSVGVDPGTRFITNTHDPKANTLGQPQKIPFQAFFCPKLETSRGWNTEI